MPNGGKLTLERANLPVAKEGAGHDGGLKPGDYGPGYFFIIYLSRIESQMTGALY